MSICQRDTVKHKDVATRVRVSQRGLSFAVYAACGRYNVPWATADNTIPTVAVAAFIVCLGYLRQVTVMASLSDVTQT
jgi:hypothetical protein